MHLSQSCLLTTLSLRAMGRARKDAARTAAVNADRGTQDGYSVTKHLFPGQSVKYIKPVLDVQADAKRWWLDHSVQSDEEGKRLLRKELLAAADTYIRGAQADLVPRVNDLAANMEWTVETALVHLNGDGNPKDYACRENNAGTLDHGGKRWALPSVDVIRTRFAILWRVEPVPDTAVCSAVLQDLLSSEFTAHEAEWKRREEQAREIARLDVLQRFSEPLVHAVKTFRDTATSAPRKDSIAVFVRDIRKVVDLLPELNVTGDPDIAALQAEAEAALCGFSEEGLKANPTARETVAAKAQAILDRMAGYL